MKSMIINDHRVDNYIHDVALMAGNFFRMFVSSMAKVVCLRNVRSPKGEFVSVVGPLDAVMMDKK